MKKRWENAYEYRRILEILDDYWLSEPYEDWVKVKMAFVKGNEYQTKYITWRRKTVKSENIPEPVNAAKLLAIHEGVYLGINEFVKNMSDQLRIEKSEVWSAIEHFADMYFVEQNLKRKGDGNDKIG